MQQMHTNICEYEGTRSKIALVTCYSLLCIPLRMLYGILNIFQRLSVQVM